MSTAQPIKDRSHIVMVAAENDALSGAKVGGIGDVIRDLPAALAPLGWKTTVLIPSYGFLHTRNRSRLITEVEFPFGGGTEKCGIWRALAVEPTPGPPRGGETDHLIVHHGAISGDPIYFNDPRENVFARDATKFALFCSAAGRYLESFGEPYVLHLHDWHTGFLFLLSGLHPAFSHLKKVRKVFTIHNIGYQGTRPLSDHPPSVRDWFPELFDRPRLIGKWRDPRYDIPSFTPMLAGIDNADAVTTVSPTYAAELMTESDRANAVYGGDGLESALRKSHTGGRLHGILNGIEYPPARSGETVTDRSLLGIITSEIAGGEGGGDHSLHDEVLTRLERVLGGKRKFILTSITRITAQKIRLLLEKGSEGQSALDSILTLARERDAAWIFVGSGIDEYETELREAFLRHGSFIFLNGFYKNTAAALFKRGDLFVMPSSYEPCGITQMLAMREGQPCLVHAVGGLKDTVIDGVNGFAFSGKSLVEKVDNLVGAAARAIDLYSSDPSLWKDISRAAQEARFRWDRSAAEYDRIFRGAAPAGREADG